MRQSHRIILPWRWTLLCLLLLLNSVSWAELAVPPLEARVTDLTGTLSATQRSRLENELREFETRKGSQIAILLVSSTAPETVEQYALRVAEKWQLGRKGVDDGLLILVAMQDRAIRLEVGYGLEGVVPDAIAKRIISEIITPYFRQGDYYGGLVAGVDRLVRLIDGEPLPAPRDQDKAGASESGLPVLLFAVVALGSVLRAIFGQLFGASIVSAVIGVAVWLLFGSLMFALLAAIFAFVITLFGGGGRGGRYGGINVGSGGFGGGVFRGGGGGFGGGGASGRW